MKVASDGGKDSEEREAKTDKKLHSDDDPEMAKSCRPLRRGLPRGAKQAGDAAGVITGYAD